MRVVILGTAILACALPAFGQVGTFDQSFSPVTPATCEAAFVSPGVPSAIVVLTVPAPAFPTGGTLAAPQPHGTRSSLAPPHAVVSPSSRPGGVVYGPASLSGIGSMERSGIGSIGTGGIGSMTMSGIGSIGMGGIGSIGSSSPGFPPSPSSPFASPMMQPTVGSSAPVHANAQPHRVPLQRLPFICP